MFNMTLKVENSVHTSNYKDIKRSWVHPHKVGEAFPGAIYGLSVTVTYSHALVDLQEIKNV